MIDTIDLNSLEILGQDANVRRWILSVLLTSQYHLTSRPTSFANESFASHITAYCHRLLDILNLPGWDRLEDQIEDGIATLKPVSEFMAQGAKSDRERFFASQFRRYFRSLHLPWSRLSPVDSLPITSFPDPDQVLIIVGPNIGIGDEITFMPIARHLAERFPKAQVYVYSHHATLWDRCTFLAGIEYSGCSPLTPYARAKQLLHRQRNALVVFIEFASAPMYRHLENVPGLSRFLYLDSGAKVARHIDQARGRIFEYRLGDVPIYETIKRLCASVGLEISAGPSILSNQCKHVEVSNDVTHIFLNPFSSKNPRELSPQWWAAVVDRLAEVVDLEVKIFAGINGPCHDFAGQISAQITKENVSCSLFGGDATPTIIETLDAAVSSDLVLGLDTFTTHCGVLRRTRGVAILFGRFWEAWKVPDSCVFYATTHDSPELVSALAQRLLIPPDLTVKTWASDVVKATSIMSQTLSDETESATDQLITSYRRCRDAILTWSLQDPNLLFTFSDLPKEYGTWLNSAIECSCRHDSSRSLPTLLRYALQNWTQSNLFRYAMYLSGCDSLRGISSTT